MLLEIKDLHVSIEGKNILKGINLNIKPGEIHAIMGPNGSGKTTLTNVIGGKKDYDTAGSIRLNDQDILNLEPSERSLLGVFVGFQNPIEIPGVSNIQFLKTALDSKNKFLGKKALNSSEFFKKLQKNLDLLEIDKSRMSRGVNEGFSGGEKKRNEVLQMIMLDPILCILDETDSGLDIDALRIVSKGIRHMKNKKRGMLIITHYQRLLNHVEPDFVHVLSDGEIIHSGDKKLALDLEKHGYSLLKKLKR